MEMDRLLEHSKTRVWKVQVERKSRVGNVVEFCTGVCIQSDGLILTHAFKSKHLVGIRLYGPENTNYEAYIVKHEVELGLALVRPTQDKIYDFMRFGDEARLGVGQILYAIRYLKISNDPIILKGYVAYDPDSKLATQYCPPVLTIGFFRRDDLVISKDVSVIQIGHLGASDDGRSSVIFDSEGNVVGILACQVERYDMAIHVDELKKFSSDAVEKQVGKLRVYKKRKRSEDPQLKGFKGSINLKL